MVRRHSFRAALVDGKISVKDQLGRDVRIHLEGTEDHSRFYAFVEAVGIIGGWDGRVERPVHELVSRINEGWLYSSVSELPGKWHKPRKSKHGRP